MQVRRAGYLAAERTVTVLANRDTHLSFAPERIAGPGRLRVETEPGVGTRVIIDLPVASN